MSLSPTRFGANATPLPGPAPLPPLSAALSRRAALFGAVTVAGTTAVSTTSAANAINSLGHCGPAQSTAPCTNDRRLAVAADTLDALQAKADRHADGAGSDPADPYTRTVAEMDLVAAGMAMLPADTMAGVMTKVRAMTVPTVAEADEAHGLALSVCRDLRRLQAMGALS